MKLQVNYGDIQGSAALHEHVAASIERSLKHMVSKVTRVEVHLRDDKQKRRGPDDKRCVVEARLAGSQPLAIEARGRNVYAVVARAADKLARAVRRGIAKQRERKKRSRA